VTPEEIEESISKIEYVIDEAVEKLEGQQKNIYLLVEAFKGKLESSTKSIEILQNAALELKREKNDVLVPQKEYRSLVAAVESLEGKMSSSLATPSLGHPVKPLNDTNIDNIKRIPREKKDTQQSKSSVDLSYLEDSVKEIKDEIAFYSVCERKIVLGFVVMSILILVDIAAHFMM